MILLPEFKGKKVLMKSINGFITFDTNKIPENEYPIYHALGFDFCFEVVEPKYKKPIAYVGVEQDADLIKPNKKKNAKKEKTETKKA